MRNYTQQAKKTVDGIEYSANIDPERGYGYFEIEAYTYYAEGGLWFNSDDELYDYDGVYELSKHVIELVESLGYTNGLNL